VPGFYHHTTKQTGVEWQHLNMLLCATKIVFVLLGLGLSIFYGLYAVYIFVPEDDPFVAAKTKYRSWWFHQFCLNFSGSAVGWLAAYCFIFYRFNPSCREFTREDVGLMLVALLGIGGFLPHTISLVPKALGSIVSLLKKE
jgi:hypothetical protein